MVFVKLRLPEPLHPHQLLAPAPMVLEFTAEGLEDLPSDFLGQLDLGGGDGDAVQAVVPDFHDPVHRILGERLVGHFAEQAVDLRQVDGEETAAQ